jgi:hypothetical protein
VPEFRRNSHDLRKCDELHADAVAAAAFCEHCLPFVSHPFPRGPYPQTAHYTHLQVKSKSLQQRKEKRAVNEKRRKTKIGGEGGKDEDRGRGRERRDMGGKKWAAFVRLLSALNEKNLQRPL